MRYLPYDDLGDTPNIIVDGSAQQATVLTLSHWPHSPTPAELRADLSAEIVWRYLDRPASHVDVEVVSNNHFDEDGLVGVYAMVEPETATRSRDLLVDIARAGDFGCFESRHAARVSFTLSGFADPARSPLGSDVFARPYPELAAALYTELLGRLPELLADVEPFRQLWADEDELLAAGEGAIAAGKVIIEEVPALDLAVVTLPEALPEAVVHRFTQDRRAWIHPMAVHNATDRLRVLTIHGNAVQLHYRYETWVQLARARPLLRVDLAPLAAQLTVQEPAGARWHFDGVDGITPRLCVVDGESGLAPGVVRAAVEAFLSGAAEAPPAWNPYDD